jgi:hypothetical protein
LPALNILRAWAYFNIVMFNETLYTLIKSVFLY